MDADVAEVSAVATVVDVERGLDKNVGAIAQAEVVPGNGSAGGAPPQRAVPLTRALSARTMSAFNIGNGGESAETSDEDLRAAFARASQDQSTQNAAGMVLIPVIYLIYYFK